MSYQLAYDVSGYSCTPNRIRKRAVGPRGRRLPAPARVRALAATTAPSYKDSGDTLRSSFGDLFEELCDDSDRPCGGQRTKTSSRGSPTKRHLAREKQVCPEAYDVRASLIERISIEVYPDRQEAEIVETPPIAEGLLVGVKTANGSLSTAKDALVTVDDGRIADVET